ncbi:MAG TPA: glycerol-3-phosphate 1-O-acyltransferase PlsY [Candidatus Acidoferrales bacterium]|nr:glycerol-3-phosphate 1-O-acyltransferase PlsY [Candidatus Acidoferrales bacterium]
MNSPWWIPALAYLLGSIPFGLLIVKARGGKDIRSMGSGNIGAANVTRNAGLVAGALTLLLDGGKGYLAVWIAERSTDSNGRWMMAAAVAAVIGHIFPVWLGFKGGKGVATTFGVFLPIGPYAVLGAAAFWVLVVLFWRYSSLGSIVAMATLPLLVYFFYAPHHAPPDHVLGGTILVSVLVLWKHRGNMRRLIAGQESRLGSPH